MYAKLIDWFHKIPHLNYRLKPVTDSFNREQNGPYIQSLVVFCGLAILFAFLLLLSIIITWICQCCRKKSDNVRSGRHIRNLSTTLFLLSVVCFILLGCCLYGNEHTTKNVNSAIHSLEDFNRNIKLGYEQLIREADSLITEVSDKLDEIKQKLFVIGNLFNSLKILNSTAHFWDRIEFERLDLKFSIHFFRWLICLVLITIMMVVLFAGVIAFCRQSRKGAIVFSGLGIVIFIVTWILFSIVFPITVAYADFCTNGNDFIHSNLNSEMYETAHFYATCSKESFPPTVPIKELSQYYSSIGENQQKLNAILVTIFNRSEEVSNFFVFTRNFLDRNFESRIFHRH